MVTRQPTESNYVTERAEPGVQTFLDRVAVEVIRATAKHGGMNSHHEAYAVILEELDEYKAEVWKKTADRSDAAMLEELVQIAAMCAKTAKSLLNIPVATVGHHVFNHDLEAALDSGWQQTIDRLKMGYQQQVNDCIETVRDLEAQLAEAQQLAVKHEQAATEAEQAHRTLAVFNRDDRKRLEAELTDVTRQHTDLADQLQLALVRVAELEAGQKGSE